MSYNDTKLIINEFYPPEDIIKISPYTTRGDTIVRIHKIITDQKLITLH